MRELCSGREPILKISLLLVRLQVERGVVCLFNLTPTSRTVQQVDVRNEQARLLPEQYRAINRLVKEDLPSAAAQYIK